MPLTHDEIRSTQPSSDSIVGSLVVGFRFKGLQDAAAFTKLHDYAKERSLSMFYGGGDAGGADEHLVGLYPWIVGKEILHVTGGFEQASGFEYKPGGLLDVMRAELSARNDEMSEYARANGLSVSPCQTFLVARGGLALALLLKGEWIDAPEEAIDDPDALFEWLDAYKEPLAKPSSGEVGYRYGTVGSSQDPFPGVVHGICLAGADATSEVVELTAERDAALDATLAAAGIQKPRYFLITRYD